MLILLSIVLYLCLDWTSLSLRTKRAACVALVLGIGAHASGIMVHALVRQPHRASAGTVMSLARAARTK
ncbi:MAG: hypothetical protein IRZ16_11595 [Myxococcaceae bacterium]|nr:hypothetical protein [Myxococcaceae bacterium]